MTTWTAPAANRVHEPMTGDERPMLEGWLDCHRQTLLSKAPASPPTSSNRPASSRPT